MPAVFSCSQKAAGSPARGVGGRADAAIV